jgi:hypothetical protein
VHAAAIGYGALCSELVQHARASAALAAASARPATAAWPMLACLASSANTRRAVCPRRCKRLGPGLARWQCHALRAWHTWGCRIGLHRCRVGLRRYPASWAAFDAFLSYSRLMRLGACGFAAGLHSRHTTRARPLSALCCGSFCMDGAPWPRFSGLHGSHARCAVTAVARGLLAGVLLGIGVQSEHRELEHGERDDLVSGMLLLTVC